jgi:hypothetical protein
MNDVLVAPPPAWVPCPKCKAQVPCYDTGNSAYFGCFNCRTFFAAQPTPGSETRVVTGFKRELPPGPSLPLGATGTLGGYYCRVTGYQVRGEQQDRTAEWREYQLRPVKPSEGDDPIDFPLQLAEYQGHWLLIRRAQSFPVTKGNYPFQKKEWTSESTGDTYRLWHRYEPVIRDAQGEFDWNILADEHLKIQEFICPPYLLSSEKISKSPPIWYLSEYLEPSQVAAAFGLSVGELLSREGTGAAQPNPHDLAPALRLFGIAAFLLLLLTCWLAITRPSATTVETFTVPAVPTATEAAASPLLPLNSDTIRRSATSPPAPAPAASTVPAASAGYSKMLVSKTITLTYLSAVDIKFTAPTLTNHWVEITANLVNEETGRGYEVTRSLEYYEGVEDGERWSEGDRSTSVVISGLPPGRYHLNLYPSSEAGMSDTTLLVELEQHSGFASNFWLVLVLMSVVPLWHWARRSSFETSRWENSNFAHTSS